MSLPDTPENLFNQGVASAATGDYITAERCFRRTLALAPDSVEALLNLGYVLDQLERPEDAILCYEAVLEISPSNAKARYNRAAHLLRSGDLIDGFADYEYRFAAINNADSRVYPQPRWDGSSLHGRSILVYCEQGLGDALMFARYLPLLARLGARIILEAQVPLISLLSSIDGVELVVAKSATPPVTDVHIPLMSLPLIFQTTLDSIPSRVPYLVPPRDRLAAWRARFEASDKFRIGLAWSGKAHPYPTRSCPPERLVPLMSLSEICFYSLQVGEQGGNRLLHEIADRIVDLTGDIRDFADSAALIVNLDLVITIDTAVAHLAGALGKPAWVMLPAAADWRWLLNRSDSPWYPTMRLFRQPKAGDWSSVISEIIRALLEEFPQKNQADINNIYENRFQEALLALERNSPDTAIAELSDLALQLPDEPAIWFNLGRAFELAGKTAAAETALQHAHELRPEAVDILQHLGKVLVQQDKVPDAFACCHKMLTLQPANALARYNLAFLQLRTGDYLAGFANFEARLAVEGFAVDTRQYLQPRWDGTPLNGKSILVFGEQGMGDVIQFCRYIPLVASLGGRVVLEIDPPLVPLFKDFPGIVQVVAKSKAPPLTDLYVQLLSLPYLFGTTLKTVPNQVPYIIPDHEKTEKWRQCLAIHKPATLRIGLVWRGNPLNPLDQVRSCPLSEFLPLASFLGTHIFSLQVGAGTNEIVGSTIGMKLIDHTDRLHDFSDTAAFIANLDLVIGIDTAVTHLAGALGKQVWVLLPHIYDWRWLAEREDSPWYPTGRVFWQHRQGDWSGTINLVKNALKELLAEKTEAEQVDIEVCYANGMRLKETGDLLGAERCFRQIVEQVPDLPDPQHSLGVVLHLQGRIAEAITHYCTATNLDPGFVKAYYNMAHAFLQCGQYQDAIAAARKTLAIEPSHADAHWLLGMLLLQQSDFQSGWQEYELRWQAKGFTSRIPELNRPLWDGSLLAGKTLLIHMEQGRGDMIQFIRYAPLVAALGARIVASTLPELISLLATVNGVDLVVDRAEPLPEFDLHIPVLSLPHRFGTIMETIPGTVPYLHPPPESCTKWTGRTTVPAGVLRVGLVWEGNRLPNADRSCPLEFLAPLLDLPRTAFYSLQIGTQAPSVLVDRLINFTADIHDFSDTAALIETLDLVISVDTAVAHLAGALGKTVWTLLPFVSDWRWLLDREDSPWYPTMRLFRQSSPGDWAGVLNSVQQALVQLLDSHGPASRSGIELLRSGDVAEAERVFAAIIAQRPNDAEALCSRGVALEALGRHEEAISCYQAALSHKPEYMQAVHNMGNTYISLGKLDYAQRCYEYVIELAPDFIPAHLALGEIGKSRHDFNLALTHYQAVSRIDPLSTDAFQGMAEIYQSEELYVEAIAAYRQALALEPGRINALNMLGSAYQCLEQPEEAENCYRQALTLEPERATVLNNLGVALNAQGRLDEAIVVLRHLVDTQPDYAEGHWNLSVALLATGNYLDGWQEFEWRFKKANPVLQRMFEQPRWDGSALNGQTILLHTEQGFGDTFQFVRYAPLLTQHGGRVIIECQVPALKRLLLSLDGVAEVVVAGDRLPAFDCHLPLMSLPLIFGTTLETIPSQMPYLAAEPADVEVWRRRLGPITKFRVGLVWFAKQSQVLNRKRSCPLQMFAPLWAIPDVQFYTLQIGVGTEQLEDVAGTLDIIDYTGDIKDFADSAALIANLDLVITIDTAVAHLAGALGARTWVVLPHVAEWRWLCQREDSPWYPSMRLFRQPAQGDWPSLMDTVATVLHDCVRDVETRNRVTNTHAEFRVGLAWSGRQDNPLNCKRSCPFSALAPLFNLKDITFVSLQMDSTEEFDTKMIDLTGQIRDFEDTAALMANLDLIISIDTSVAHLAAATGRPTWVFLSHVADWRWSPSRQYSLWYPEAELFRQPDFGDWSGVVREVTERLSRRIDGYASTLSEPRLQASTERCGLEQILDNKLKEASRNNATPDNILDVGTALALLGRDLEAAEVFQHVLELDPGHVSGHLNLAYSLLAIEDYSKAWEHLEWRLKRLTPDLLPPWPMLNKNTLGTHPPGSTVLVHCEQGYGDTIQFSRFLLQLDKAGYLVIVSCQPLMSALVSSAPGVSKVIPHGEPLPVCDLQVLLLSLPGLFSVNNDSLPVNTPYLAPSPQKVESWKKRLEEKIASERFFP